jgi:ABC-2 type transport system permease protein
MWRLFCLELFKIFKKPRTYIAFLAIAAITGLIQVAIYVDGQRYMDFFLNDIKESFDVVGNPLNGYFVCFVILQTLLVHVPLLVVLISADMIAGEANMGTLRLILTKPASRSKLLLAKFFASSFYILLLLIWIALTGLFLSLFIFGEDGMINAKSFEIILLNKDDLFWRYLLAFCFAFVALSTVGALGFLLSVFAENALGPIVATMSIVIVMTILSTLEIPLFERMRPLFFTSHMVGWKGFFEMKTDAEGMAIPGTIRNLPAITRSFGILLLHILVFYSISLYAFRKKDIAH